MPFVQNKACALSVFFLTMTDVDPDPAIHFRAAVRQSLAEIAERSDAGIPRI